MNTRIILFLYFFMFIACTKEPSVVKIPAVSLDFDAAKAYFLLVEKIQNGDTISEKEWTDFFNINGNRLFLEDFKYSNEKIESLKKNIIETYNPTIDSLSNQYIDIPYRVRYKNKHQLYKKYLARIEKMQVKFVDSMVYRTKSFLPEGLIIYREKPTIYYHALNNDGDASVRNRIFMSVLASFERNINRMANVESHELHHNFRLDLSYYKARQDSSYYKTEIDEKDRVVYTALMLALNEGLADMVDKDLLFAETSNWWRKETIQSIYLNEGQEVVKKLNEYFLEAAYGANQKWEIYDNLYLNFNGHIPGYFMAKAIKDNGRLKDVIENADNPFMFFLIYQEVALIDKKLPIFDDVVINFLSNLKTKYEDDAYIKEWPYNK